MDIYYLLGIYIFIILNYLDQILMKKRRLKTFFCRPVIYDLKSNFLLLLFCHAEVCYQKITIENQINKYVKGYFNKKVYFRAIRFNTILKTFIPL